MPRLDAIRINVPVLAFAVGTALVVVLLASLLPGRIAVKNQPGDALRDGSRSITAGGMTRNVIVVAQVAVTLILLFAGLLFARSFGALLRVNPGFASSGVLTMHLAVTRAQYPEDERVANYYRRLLSAVKGIPGVAAAGVVNRLPFSGIAQTGGVEFEGREGNYDTDWRSATSGYFEAIGIPLLQGRTFLDSDRAQSPPVGLVDERLARRVFGNENPIGKRFRRYLPGQTPQDSWAEIVGVVGHILNDSLERDQRSQVYWPETQRTQDRAALVVRTAGHPEQYTHAVVDQIQRENPNQPVYDVRVMEEWVRRTRQTRTLLTAMVALFSGASLLLACIGLYGVVSYMAALRVREFGIRMALGAAPGHVRGLVIGHAARLAAWGAAIGLTVSWPVGRALESLLFGVNGGDFFSWALAPGLLLAVALVAGWGPAGRAARLDPAVTLRAD
jgi:predicted permease